MTLDLIQGAPCLEGLLNFLRAPYFKVPADDKSHRPLSGIDCKICLTLGMSIIMFFFQNMNLVHMHKNA